MIRSAGVVLERVLAGVSTRKYRRAQDPVGEAAVRERSTSKELGLARVRGAHPRGAVATMSRQLADLRLAAAMLDGIEIKGRMNVVALGIYDPRREARLGLVGLDDGERDRGWRAALRPSRPRAGRRRGSAVRDRWLQGALNAVANFEFERPDRPAADSAEKELVVIWKYQRNRPPALRRAHADEYAASDRAAVLVRRVSPADAVRALQAEFGLSERQARRYINAGLERPDGVPVPERTAVFTVRLAPSLIDGLRTRAGVTGQSLSAVTAEAVCARILAGVLAGGAVARRLEIEFVGDRLASARLAQAYSMLAPERRCVIGNEGSGDERQRRAEQRPVEDCGDLRAGVRRAPAPRADDPESDRRAA